MAINNKLFLNLITLYNNYTYSYKRQQARPGSRTAGTASTETLSGRARG